MLWYVSFTSILKIKKKLKTFQEKQKLRQFVISRPMLPEILKEILEAKMTQIHMKK